MWEEFPEAIDSYTYKAIHTAMKEQRFISNIDYYEPLDLWQENHIYPSPEGLSIFIKDISERKKFERELIEQERKQQLQLVATTLEAQERERTQIGRELHDNVNQIITATKLILSYLKEHPEKAEEMMPLCINNLDKVIQENRKLAHELVPPDFKEASFVRELSNLIQPMFNTKGIKTKLDTSEFDENLLYVDKKLTE